jgi:hypothetical protein
VGEKRSALAGRHGWRRPAKALARHSDTTMRTNRRPPAGPIGASDTMSEQAISVLGEGDPLADLDVIPTEVVDGVAAEG